MTVCRLDKVYKTRKNDENVNKQKIVWYEKLSGNTEAARISIDI